VHIRAIRPEDKERLLAHFHGLGPDSVRFRFLGAKKELTAADLRYFTELDFVRHVGLVITRRQGEADEFIGVGRYVCGENGQPPRSAEFALAVTDPWQGRGVGTLLLEHLARIAAFAGIERFQADILEGNTRMLDVLAGLGFRVEERSRDGVVRAWFEIDPGPDAIRASDERAWRAAAESVRAVLHPRSVAVVGASQKTGTIGAALIRNVVKHGFNGPIYPVNPKGGTIEGLTAYPSVKAIGQTVDLGVIAVPAPAVHEAVAECAAAGARGVVVISAGFAEASAEGRAAQRRLREMVRGAGLRMVGPNCMGVLNTDPEVSLDATFAPTFPPEGNVAMLSQSGALGLAILDYARDLDIGLSTFVSVATRPTSRATTCSPTGRRTRARP
jgi:predicted CoA-binding protein/GNAT superfamily N-acetyltransferase